MEWMIVPLRRYADFRGRARRKEYWWFNLGITVLLGPLLLYIWTAGESGGQSTAAGLGLVAILLLVLELPLLVPALAVTVRRLHDQDLSGWIILLGLIPFIGQIGLLFVMSQEGTRGANRFGGDPIDRSAGTA